MSTDQLIARLSGRVPRVSRHVIAGRITIGVAAGCFAAAFYMNLTIGFRPDLGAVLADPSFWMKAAYTLSMATVATVAATRLARPGAEASSALWLVAIPALVLACIGVWELASTPTREWGVMWFGRSWRSCPWRILTLAGPVFAGLLWSFRRLAPTRLRAAGAAAGLSAGGWASLIYCLHCPEASAIFVLTWYTLGIGLAAGLGALAGPRLLRW